MTSFSVTSARNPSARLRTNVSPCNSAFYTPTGGHIVVNKQHEAVVKRKKTTTVVKRKHLLSSSVIHKQQQQHTAATAIADYDNDNDAIRTSRKRQRRRVQFAKQNEVQYYHMPQQENLATTTTTSTTANMMPAVLLAAEEPTPSLGSVLGEQDMAVEISLQRQLYSDALHATYLACCLAPTTASTTTSGGSSSFSKKQDLSSSPTNVPPEYIELLGGSSGELRGVAGRSNLRLTIDRYARKMATVKFVVQRYRNLINEQHANDPTTTTTTTIETELRFLSEDLSAPAKRFARALGIADSLAALQEYTSSTSSSSPSQP